jgi:hypothetical protein
VCRTEAALRREIFGAERIHGVIHAGKTTEARGTILQRQRGAALKVELVGAVHTLCKQRADNKEKQRVIGNVRWMEWRHIDFPSRLCAFLPVIDWLRIMLFMLLSLM